MEKQENKQKIILDMATITGGRITKVEAVNLLGSNYYHNASKYVGEILSRMVKSGKLIRVKPGVFEVKTARNELNINQITLF